MWGNSVATSAVPTNVIIIIIIRIIVLSQWLAHLFPLRDVMGSMFGPKKTVRTRFTLFSLLRLGKCRDNQYRYLKIGHGPFL